MLEFPFGALYLLQTRP